MLPGCHNEGAHTRMARTEAKEKVATEMQQMGVQSVHDFSFSLIIGFDKRPKPKIILILFYIQSVLSVSRVLYSLVRHDWWRILSLLSLYAWAHNSK